MCERYKYCIISSYEAAPDHTIQSKGKSPRSSLFLVLFKLYENLSKKRNELH
jgi:hypothetical protein